MKQKIEVVLNAENNNVEILSPRPLSPRILNELCSFNETNETIYTKYSIETMPYNCFVIACLIIRTPSIFNCSDETLSELKSRASSVCKPKAFLQNDSYLGIHVPLIPAYERLMGIINAKHVKLNLWTVPFSRLYEAYRVLNSYKHSFLPPIEIQSDLEEFVSQELRETTTMQDLFSVELEELISVRKGWQIKPDGFKKLKYESACDLLLRRPKSYVDRTKVYTYKQAPFGKPVYIKGTIISFTSFFDKSSELVLFDGEQEIIINFWGFGYLTRIYRPGTIIYAEVTKTWGGKANGTSIISPEEIDALPVTPNYRQSPSNKITTKVLTNCVDELFKRFDGSNLCDYLFKKENDKSFWELLHDLHFPKDINNYFNTLDKLAYLELVYLQLIFIDKKFNEIKSPGLSKYPIEEKYLHRTIKNLPYKLTDGEGGQTHAIKQVLSRLRSSEAETVLLSGDVGSGKTTISLAASLYTAESGYQTALVAPTEILAKQLYDNFIKFISPLKDKPVISYLSGNIKSKDKNDILREVRNGNIQILIGTHSVFDAEFNNLGLIIIDEQQKFGRSQREKLLFSRKDGKVPDLIEQTATPIPQSTALAFYGDTDLISVTQKPNNRKENITNWIKKSSNDFLNSLGSYEWNTILEEINSGRQMFVVTPAVEEDSKMASVKKVEKALKKKLGNNIKVDTVHGKLTKEKQNQKLQEFRDNKFQILIASTVIEVGIDIPNATVMLVLDANRFGASSLHQIRGRVGRSDYQGYCYLVSDNSSTNTEKRLNSLVNSNDGFVIAMVDLETRKEGDLFGERQSGESRLLYCDLTDHSKLIELARHEAEIIYKSKDKNRALEDAKTFLRYAEVNN